MSSTGKTTKKWELLPTAAKEGIECPAKLEEGTVQAVGAQAPMPAKMLALLFKKLSTDKNVPSIVRQGLNYFLYFIEDKMKGVNKNSQKMDFLTFYLIVADGLVNWPLEITTSLRALAEEHAMYKIVESVNTGIIRTQLCGTQNADDVT